MGIRIAVPTWLPLADTSGVVATAKWWDAVIVPQGAALNSLAILDHESGHSPGPVTLEPPGAHWRVPPDPDAPDALVDAARREALLTSAQAS